MAEPWTEDNPGSVELGCMYSANTALTNASTNYSDAKTSIGTTQTVVADWVGAAAEAWRGSATTLGTDLDGSRDRLLAAKEAISAYRQTTYSINTRASTARRELEAALDVWSVPQPNQITQPTEFETWQSNRYLATYREQDARAEIYRLALERYAADEDAIRALTAALPDNWSATVAALASVGITGIGDMTRSANSDAMLELSQRIAAGNASPEDYDALALMLGMYENNESMMSDLFTDLGGEDTVRLVEAIGDWGASDPMIAAAALALGILTRSGLSTGSRNWTQGAANDFAESMFNVGQDKGDSIAYLFSDVVDSPLGETLAIAAANAIDEFERVEGRNWLMDETGGGLWLGLQEFGDDGNRMSDASGPIFSTLGHYPDSAYEWLTDTSDGGDRVDYWYHDRYDPMYWYSEEGHGTPWYIPHDGFQGVGDLWFGALQAEGGPVYPDGTVANPEDAAALSSRIMQALITGGLFTSDNISDAASASLAAGFVVNLPAFSELIFDGKIDGDLTSGAQQLDNGSWLPVIDPEDLAAFLGRVGSQDSGADVLSFGISSYQETLFNMALESGNPGDIQEALGRIVNLQALLEGSNHGQDIEDAQATDAEREAIVSGISSVLGALPIPGLGDAVSGVGGWVLNWGQGVVLGNLTGAGSDGIADLWATQTENVINNYDAAEGDALNQQLSVTIANSLYTYFQDVDPSVLAGVGAPTGNMDVWYEQNADQLQTNFAGWVNAGQPDSAFSTDIIQMYANDYSIKVDGWATQVDDYDGVVEYEPS